MSDFAEKMRLKGRGDEDSYFARRDRELIEQRRQSRRALPLRRIISGGQTGVDRAALDVALERAPHMNLGVGGWCPKGRWAEDGRIPARYPLQETASAEPAERTERNLRDSDATLVLCRGEPAGGTVLTVALARELGRPLYVVDLAGAAAHAAVLAWLRAQDVAVLNIAGPRESQAPGIAREAANWLRDLLDQI